MDVPQLDVVVDPTLSLQECIAQYEAQRDARMSMLEKGGLLTGRALEEFTRRRLSPRTMGKIDADAQLPEDALMQDDTSGVGRRSKSMVFLDLKARSAQRATVSMNPVKAGPGA